MEIDKNLPTHYRYSNYGSEDGVTVKLSRFYPIRETECFYYVVSENTLIQDGSRTYSENPKLTKIGKDSLRGYCHITKERALKSFKVRQNHRIWHANYSLAIAEQSLLVLDQIEAGDFDYLDVGKPEFFNDVNWGW